MLSESQVCLELPGVLVARHSQSWEGNKWPEGQRSASQPFQGLVGVILGISSSQLTNSYLSEGWLNHQPAKKGEDHGKIRGDFHEANRASSESVEHGKSTMTGESMRGTCWNPSIPGVSMDPQVRGCLISSNHPSVDGFDSIPDGFDSEMVHLTATCNCKQSCMYPHLNSGLNLRIHQVVFFRTHKTGWWFGTYFCPYIGKNHPN